MTKLMQKQQAISWRKKGYSINEIAKRLYVSTSTVSNWCRDVALSQQHIERIAKRSHHHATISLLQASERQRKQRQIDTQTSAQLGIQDVGQLTTRDIHMVGLGLYWGEGYKKGSQELGFTNNDPLLITFYLKWLEIVFQIKKADLIFRVSINDQHSKRVPAVLAYWSRITKTPIGQFTKTSLIRSASKKVYSNHAEHYGTLRVKVRRGTQLRRRILGSLSALIIK